MKEFHSNRMADHTRGKLKIYMGYAAGVGKTYKMLEEAQALKSQGMDLVVGYFEPHDRKDTIQKTEGLEIIPRAKIHYRDSVFEEMDTDAILSRHPQLCLVDEFAHTNIPGSPRTKRWQDVEVLRDAGIAVHTTMNIQHLESLNDQIWQIADVRVRETVPDWAVQGADEVVVIDLSPRALLHRLKRGVVYRQDKIEQALRNFFRESTHEIEQRSVETGFSSEGHEIRGNRHKILVFITPDPQTAMVIRRAKRVSDFIGAECFAATVQPFGDLSRLSEEKRDVLGRHLNFARNLRIETRIIEGSDIARALVDFARLNKITQIFLARTRARAWAPFGSARLLQSIVHLAKDMQIIIVSERKPDSEA
jgi:two-component system sensor histidine kinase KdpD